jgi:hypothetical protein
MPFFTDKFVLKKTPARKSDAIANAYRSIALNDNRTDFGTDSSTISLTMDGRRVVFDETSGKWFLSSRTPDVRDSSDPSDNMQKVLSENRLLRLKIEILTDLVSIFSNSSSIMSFDCNLYFSLINNE